MAIFNAWLEISIASILLMAFSFDSVIAKFPDPVPIIGGPGTAAIFHCNLLHASGHNLSSEDRWQIFFCFNKCANRPDTVDNPRPDFVRSTNWSPLKLSSNDSIIDHAKITTVNGYI